MTAGHDVYCFTHVMKTAGTSFVFYMRENVPPERIYPGKDEGLEGHFMLDRLRAVAPERRAGLRAYAGHFPAFAADLVGATRTVTLLRHPVERTISHLKQWQRVHRPDLTLEQIYDDPFLFEAFIHDHQTKIFSLTEADAPGSYMNRLAIDRDRLEMAKARLSRIDVVGVQERYPALVRAVQDAFGWAAPVATKRVLETAPVEVSAAFRARIADDNRFDMELYDWAAAHVAA